MPAAEEEALLHRLEALARHDLSAEVRAAMFSGDPEDVRVLDANETRVRGRLATVSFTPVPISAPMRLHSAVDCGARDDACAAA